MVPFSFQRHWRWILFAGLPLVLWGVSVALEPFPNALVTRSLSTAPLSAPQKTNLRTAVRYLESVVLRPGEVFSFNRAVGPRTSERGYVAAPAYVGPDSLPSVGGGLCLLSSALYQLALLEGLRVEERVPHLRTIHSVPAGLDASVWYGQADLRFRNTTPRPLLLRVRMTDNRLMVSLWGRGKTPEITFRRLERHPSAKQVWVQVFEKSNGRERLVSRDLYGVSP